MSKTELQSDGKRVKEKLIPSANIQQRESNSEEDISQESFETVYRRLSKKFLQMLMSFDYSMGLVAWQFMFAYLKGNGTQDDKTDYQAAGTLALLFFDIANTVSVSSLISVAYVGGPLYAEIKSSSNDEHDKINEFSRIFINSQIVNLVWLVPSAFSLIFSKQILEALGQDQRIAGISADFLIPIAPLLFCISPRLAASMEYFIVQRENLVLKITLPNLLLFGIGLAYLLGIEVNLGPIGIFTGIAVQHVISALCFFWGLRSLSEFKDFRFLQTFSVFSKQNLVEMWKIFKTGTNFVLTYFSELTALFATNIIAGNIGADDGVDELAALNFARQCSYLGLAISHANAQSVVFSINQVQQKADKSRIAKIGLVNGICMTLIPCFPIMVYPQMLTKGSVSDQVESYTNSLVPLAGANAVIYTGALTMLLSLRTTENKFKPTFLFIAAIWVGVLLSYLLADTADQGVLGIGLGSFIGTLLGSFSIFPQWKREFMSDNDRDTKQESSGDSKSAQNGSSFWSCSCITELISSSASSYQRLDP